VIDKPHGYKLLPGIKNYRVVKKGTPFASNGTSELRAPQSFCPILFGDNTYPDYFGFGATVRHVGIKSKNPR
jgi:hypothetical protein